MSIECPKCGLEHEQVDVIRWLWLFRDIKPKPTGKAIGILAMLAARMDGTTGCGWTTDPDLAELAGCGRHAVERATRWGRDRLLLHRVSKGYRITDERGQKSHWLLTDPATQRLLTDPTSHSRGDGSDPTSHSRGDGSPDPTSHSRRANVPSVTDPIAPQRASKANPEKLNQEADPSRRRPVVNSSLEGVRDGQGDDDDSETYKPDPRMILAGLGVDEPEAGVIVARLEASGVGDPAAYLLGIAAKSDGEVRDFLDWIRR